MCAPSGRAGRACIRLRCRGGVLVKTPPFHCVSVEGFYVVREVVSYGLGEADSGRADSLVTRTDGFPAKVLGDCIVNPARLRVIIPERVGGVSFFLTESLTPFAVGSPAPCRALARSWDRLYISRDARCFAARNFLRFIRLMKAWDLRARFDGTVQNGSFALRSRRTLSQSIRLLISTLQRCPETPVPESSPSGNSCTGTACLNNGV